ncbi:unnamed protein product, partial [Effrenium voratum]
RIKYCSSQLASQLMGLEQVSVLPGQQATYQCRTHKECTALLHRLSHSHAWQRALEVVGVFRQNVLEPNIINRNALLSSLQRGRQWARVCSLLFARSRTDVWSFSTAAGAFDSWRSPLWLLERIGHARHAPNVVLAGAILSSCEVPGAWSMALALFGQMPLKEPHRVVGLGCRESGKEGTVLGKGVLLDANLLVIARCLALSRLLGVQSPVTPCSKDEKLASHWQADYVMAD